MHVLLLSNRYKSVFVVRPTVMSPKHYMMEAFVKLLRELIRIGLCSLMSNNGRRAF